MNKYIILTILSLILLSGCKTASIIPIHPNSSLATKYSSINGILKMSNHTDYSLLIESNGVIYYLDLTNLAPSNFIQHLNHNVIAQGELIGTSNKANVMVYRPRIIYSSNSF